MTPEQHQNKRTGEATSKVAGAKTMSSENRAKAMAGAVHIKRIEETKV